jgi:hypothetical protein
MHVAAEPGLVAPSAGIGMALEKLFASSGQARVDLRRLAVCLGRLVAAGLMLILLRHRSSWVSKG